MYCSAESDVLKDEHTNLRHHNNALPYTIIIVSTQFYEELSVIVQKLRIVPALVQYHTMNK